MSKSKTIVKVETWLPIFPGFYNTLFEYSSEPEYDLFNDPSAVDKLLVNFAVQNVHDYIDYTAYQNDVAECATSYIEAVSMELLPGIIEHIKFQSVSSPGYYNFSNDTVNIELELDFNALLKAFIRHKHSAEYLKENYTSRDGFNSYHPNNMSDWIEAAWDHQQHTAGSMLAFFLMLEDERSELIQNIYEDVSDSVYSSEYIKYDELCEAVNDEFTFSTPLKAWDQEELEAFQAIVGGTRFDQELTGIGLFEIDPENIPEAAFHDEYGLYRT